MESEPEELRGCARAMRRLAEKADEVRGLADGPAPDGQAWGLVGMPFAFWYANTADEVCDDLGFVTDCLGSIADGLDSTAENVELCDRGIAEALQQIEQALDDPGGPGMNWHVGSQEMVSFDPGSDIPGVSPAMGMGSSVPSLIGAARSGDDFDWSELSGAMGAASSLGAAGAAAWLNPLQALINNGLGFLVSVVQPLDDELAKVTGDPDRMDEEIRRWERVGQAQGQMAEAVARVADEGLAHWRDGAVPVARERIGAFVEGVAGTQEDVRKVAYILEIAKTTMEAARSFILGLISSFVEWMVYTWATATATAPVTFGGSTAAASAVTAGRLAYVLARARMVVAKVVDILRTVVRVLGNMKGVRAQRLSTSFTWRDRGAVSQLWGSARAHVATSLKDWKSHLQLYQIGASGAADRIADHHDNDVSYWSGAGGRFDQFREQGDEQ